jgi:dicarboxylate transporter 10
MTANIVKTNGFFALYQGISAAVLRQATYSTTRFACYEALKTSLTKPNQEMPLYQKIGIAGASGFFGGVLGTPADLVNVRMQNDCKLPVEQRRNYKNCIEALFRIAKQEGPSRMFAGVWMASTRGMFVTIGQLAFYDELKYRFIKTGYFQDNLTTHFSAAVGAGVIATCFTMPLDVLKTRIMNAAPGQYSGAMDAARDVLKVGPSGFFKGFIPAFVRLGPHTVLTFVFLEQLKKFML